MAVSERRIAEILAHHDPERLIVMGAPAAEYKSEAGMLYDYLARYTREQLERDRADPQDREMFVYYAATVWRYSFAVCPEREEDYTTYAVCIDRPLRLFATNKRLREAAEQIFREWVDDWQRWHTASLYK